MGGQILDAVVVPPALLAASARASIVAHSRKTGGHCVHVVVVAMIPFGFDVAGAVGDDFIQPFANAHAFALSRLPGGFPRVEAYPLDAPRRRLVHHLIRWTRLARARRSIENRYARSESDSENNVPSSERTFERLW